MNAGFGAPSSYIGPGQKYDIGFGSSGMQAAAEGDWGFGDKGANIQVLVVLPIIDNGEYPDDGGLVLKLKADWKVITPGPYQVQLREHFTLQAYPQDKFGCWSCIPGKPWECEPNGLATELQFALPPLPPGIYDVLLNYGPALGMQLVTLNAIKVIWRGRQSQAYSLRRHLLPAWHGAGSRAPTADILVGV